MLRAGHLIALCVLALLTLGVVMVNSADMQVSRVAAGETIAPALTPMSIITSRSTLYMVLALAALGIGAFVPVRSLAERAMTLGATGYAGLISCVVLLMGTCALVYMPVVGKNVNGAHRWIHLPVPGIGDVLSVQPSEIAKWALVAVMSWWAASRREGITSFWRGLVPALAAVGAVAAFIVVEDLGTGVLIAGVAALVLLAGGARLWQFLMFVPVGLGGIVYAIVHSSYRMKRVMAFVHPYEDPRGIGYHTVQSLIAISGGEVFGRGLGNGLQKFGYLPEDRTDFIFPIICEELGIAGAAFVILLFAGLAWSGYAVMREERNPMLRLFSLGVIATVSLQAVMNLAVVTALAPTKGIALPLVSSGGTGWILTSFCLGLVVAVSRTQPVVEQTGGGALATA